MHQRAFVGFGLVLAGTLAACGMTGFSPGTGSPPDGPGDGDSTCMLEPWTPGSETVWPEEACTPEAAPDGGVDEPTPPAPAVGLMVAQSCAEAADGVKTQLLRENRRALAQNLARALAVHCQPCTPPPPQPCPPDGGWWGPADGGVPRPPVADPGGGDDSASSYSQTNTQVEGVDEPDFVKNDGAYLYIVAPGRFDIIDAWPAAEMQTISSQPLEGTPRRLYVSGDRAVVFSSLGYGADPRLECTYAYDCDFTGDGMPLRISVFDIADRTQPRLLRQIDFSGAYVSSRRIGNIVHTVVVSGEAALPSLPTWPVGLTPSAPYCGTSSPPRRSAAEIREMFAKLEAENEAAIEAYAPTLTQLSLRVHDERYIDGATVTDEHDLTDCQGLLFSAAGDGRNVLTLASFDLSALEPLGLTSVFGKPGAVYGSASSLYVAQRHYRGETTGWYYDSSAVSDATTVHKFRLTPGVPVTSYAGSGLVPGHVLNQFAMDEHDGFLRIATSLGRVPDPNVSSAVTVLAEEAGDLVEVGALWSLAPGEDIRAVRFDGDTGFVVTFKKTDPLFVIDLADPEAPAVRGELHIPGFSTYIHLMDPGHLLTIGYDADDMGSFAWFQGVMLQVFDVTDLANPLLLHKEVIGTRGSASDATTNHLAFNYFKPLDLLAIPMVVCEEGSGGVYGGTMSFNGLLVYRVTLADGFTRLGGIPHNDGPETDPYGCGQWWSSARSPVERSVIMDTWVYSVARDLIRVSGLDDLEHPVTSVVP